MDDFHKFALLIKEKQESLLNEIPTIKLDDTDDDDDDQEECSYIRDTDVLVECKTEGENNSGDDIEMSASQDELLIATDRYRSDTGFLHENNTLSLSGYDSMPWLTAEETSYK